MNIATPRIDFLRQAEVVGRLKARLPASSVLFQTEDTRPYETDGLSAYRQLPMVVALPASDEEVQFCLRTCHALGVPVIARGAGTGLSGGALPSAEGVLLVTAKMMRILAVDPVARIARSSMLDVLREQFITAGRAKGLAEHAVIYKHALKNAMIPTVTVIGISFAILISGAVVVETVFNIPGLGRLIISAVLRRDYPVIQGVVLCIAGAYMVINLVDDLSYTLFDPRVKYQ